MAKEILWSEDGEKVYGWKEDFKNADEFIEEVKSQYDGGSISVENIKIETCISSTESIPADVVIPLTSIKVTIENFITGIIEEED